MPTINHKACYGTMLPDSEDKDLRSGKAFSLKAVTPAGIVRQHLHTVIDMAQWDDCLACPEFEHCYRLCLARVQLQAAANS
jgi:hypothetical protein